jgi:hypothetical protein
LVATTAAGFPALGAFADRAGPDVRQLYDDAQVRCHEMLALVVSDDEGETIRSAQALADAAGVMGAEWVLTVFSYPLTTETAPIVQRSAAVIAEVAAMAVEFSPLGPISSVRTALGVVGVANAGAGRAGLLIDTWHFDRGESTWHDLEAVPWTRSPTSSSATPWRWRATASPARPCTGVPCLATAPWRSTGSRPRFCGAAGTAW